MSLMGGWRYAQSFISSTVKSAKGRLSLSIMIDDGAGGQLNKDGAERSNIPCFRYIFVGPDGGANDERGLSSGLLHVARRQGDYR